MLTLLFQKTDRSGGNLSNRPFIAKQSFGNKVDRFFRFQRFKNFSPEKKIEQLKKHGTKLNLSHTIKSAAFVLYAYQDFFVELVIEKYTGEIRTVNCFKSVGSWNSNFHKLMYV